MGFCRGFFFCSRWERGGKRGVVGAKGQQGARVVPSTRKRGLVTRRRRGISSFLFGTQNNVC